MMRRSVIVIGVMLVIVAGVSIHAATRLPDVLAVVGHGKLGHGLDADGNQVTWHTLSLRLLSPDPRSGLAAGDTLAYVVSGEDYEWVTGSRDRDVVFGQPDRAVRARIVGPLTARVVEVLTGDEFERALGGHGGIEGGEP